MVKNKPKFFLPYKKGDVVLIEGEEHIIDDVNIYGRNAYSYSTNRSAWHEHDDCIFVRKADEASFTQLLKDLGGEEESYYEEC